MRYEILLTVEALEDFRSLPARDRSTIRATIERHLRHEPAKVSKSRIKRLRGLKHPQYRLRVGEYRVFYDVTVTSPTGGAVEVFAIVAKSRTAEWLEREGEEL